MYLHHHHLKWNTLSLLVVVGVAINVEEGAVRVVLGPARA
jgi:hypothetical protein